MEAERYTIGELAGATGLTVRTLHHYDRIGLLHPTDRSPSGYRSYGREDVRRLYRILALRQLGLSLKDIDAALAGDWADLREAIARHLAEVQRQLALSRSLEHKLRRLLDRADRDHDHELTNEQFIDAMETIVSFTHLYSGKVRDIYDAGGDRLLLVASDRMSAFDVVMGEPVPDKGRVLTAITAFWLDQLADLAPNHLVSLDVAGYPADAVEGVPYEEEELKGRSMLVRKAEMLQIECIVRGYIAGSAWKEYRSSGTMHGASLPAGLQESSKLPEPVFTPSTKAETGHDENISFEAACDLVGADLAKEARALSLAAYERGAALAAERGIIIADTKFELGMIDGRLSLCDEVLTPDSSRFWPADGWKPGTTPPSFDKQPLRDHLETLDWDKTPPPPALPAEVVAASRERYVTAYERITGLRFADWLGVSGGT
jgi:phosphoribosylaminoimidazole-succinocarboxamide synthase